ncbi:unnamed protein product [Amoebophrya sp. A25]|nr:unnamed protein product [Amoebophrya sp. A25]|eukprot:GSA25T00023208001.1
MKERNARRARAREAKRAQAAEDSGQTQDDEMVTIVWLRDDMRLVDNHALSLAACSPQTGGIGCGNMKKQAVVPVFIHDPSEADYNPYPLRGAGLWYKGASLRHFAKKLKDKFNVQLIVRFGHPLDVLCSLAVETGAKRVVWNERYEPWLVNDVDEFVRRRLMRVRIGDRLEDKVSRGFWRDYSGEEVLGTASTLIEDEEESASGSRPDGAGGSYSSTGAGWSGTTSSGVIKALGDAGSKTGREAKIKKRKLELIADGLDAESAFEVARMQFEDEENEAGQVVETEQEQNTQVVVDLPRTAREQEPSSSPPSTLSERLRFTEEIEVIVCPGSLLAAPWVSDPEKNAEGWGFGSVQWYKKALCNIPMENMVDHRAELGLDVDGKPVTSSCTTGSGKGSSSAEVSGPLDLEEYLKPLPEVQNLVPYAPSSNTGDRGGGGVELFSFSLDDLAYEWSFGKGMPVTEQKAERMKSEDPRYLPKEATSWSQRHPQWKLGIFKQFNPRYYDLPPSGRRSSSSSTTAIASSSTTAATSSSANMKASTPSGAPSAQYGKVRPGAASVYDWAYEMKQFWPVGEGAAQRRLDKFCDEVLAEGLFEGRERFRADRQYTALLSPYVRFGEVSARTCFARGAQVLGEIHLPEKGWRQLRATFLRRFLWRDLAYWCLWRFPDLPDTSLRSAYETQKWWTEEDDKKNSGSFVGGSKKEMKNNSTGGGGGGGGSTGGGTEATAGGQHEMKTRNRFRKKVKEPVEQKSLGGAGSFAPPGRSQTAVALPITASEVAGVVQQPKSSCMGHIQSYFEDRDDEQLSTTSTQGQAQRPPSLAPGPDPSLSSIVGGDKQELITHLRAGASAGTRLRRWQRGKTGFPLVDAAMRQLWRIGWMPNYLRHVCAQFLIEYLDINWKEGFKWFDYTLIDTDVAINAHMWQNGGHSGLDQWNFVMHPVFAAKSCDPDGDYVRRWLPELKSLPVEYIHCPWQAPAKFDIAVLQPAAYPFRVINDLDKARKLHAERVLAVRKEHRKELVSTRGNEYLWLDCDYVEDWTPEWELDRRKHVEKMLSVSTSACKKVVEDRNNRGGGGNKNQNKKGSGKGTDDSVNEEGCDNPKSSAGPKNGTKNKATKNRNLGNTPSTTAERSTTDDEEEEDVSLQNLITMQQQQQANIAAQKERAKQRREIANNPSVFPRMQTMLPTKKNNANTQGNKNKNSRASATAEARAKGGMRQRVELITRVDFREDSLDFLTQQTADRPRHLKKRELKNTWEQQLMNEVMNEWRRTNKVDVEDVL